MRWNHRRGYIVVAWLAVACSGSTEDGTERGETTVPRSADASGLEPPAGVGGGQSLEPADDDGSDPSDDDAVEPVPVATGGPEEPSIEPVLEPDIPAPEQLLEPSMDDVLDDGMANDCEREIEFDSLLLSDPPPFDVVIVADHSDSLSWSREDLSDGLSELLSEVSGSDARFFVLTPTQYGADSAAISYTSGEDLVPWRDVLTGEPYTDAMTTYSQSCLDRDGAPISCPEYAPSLELEFSLEGRFDFRMPGPVAAISKDMSEAEIAQQQEAIKDAILSLGGGASYEQPLCTLARYVSQSPELLPANVVFLLLADEDDQTSPLECLNGVFYERYRTNGFTTECSGPCDLNRYEVSATGARVAVEFTCVPTDDLGNVYPELAEDRSFTYGGLFPGCDGVVSAPCSEEDVERTVNNCAPGDLIENCVRSCDEGEATRCSVDVADTSVDACTESFSFNGATYDDVADYCTQSRNLEGWTGCSFTGYALVEGGGNWAGGMSPRMVASGTETSAIIDYFRRTAETVLGSENYRVEAIVHDPAFSCALGDGQSYATNLVSIATEGGVFPICEAYGPALTQVNQFARQLLQTQYTFALTDRETIEAVVVTDQWGKERELQTTEYSYDRDTSQLTLDVASVRSSDRSLVVEVAVHCQPVAR